MSLEHRGEWLLANPAAGDTRSFEKPVLPAGGGSGHEAPRGLRSHGVVIDKGVIEDSRVVVPAPWNAAPRSEDDLLGPYGSALRGSPLADQAAVPRDGAASTRGR